MVLEMPVSAIKASAGPAGRLPDSGGKAHTQNNGGTTFCHTSHRLLTLGFVGDLKFHHLDAGFAGEFLNTVVDTLIERFVELAAQVEDHRWPLALGLGHGRGAAWERYRSAEVVGAGDARSRLRSRWDHGRRGLQYVRRSVLAPFGGL